MEALLERAQEQVIEQVFGLNAFDITRRGQVASGRRFGQ
jgi:hypothetical protein